MESIIKRKIIKVYKSESWSPKEGDLKVWAMVGYNDGKREFTECSVLTPLEALNLIETLARE